MRTCAIAWKPETPSLDLLRSRLTMELLISNPPKSVLIPSFVRFGCLSRFNDWRAVGPIGLFPTAVAQSSASLF